uniref:helix-turn-helix domain-containing protein n=1 Tax=Mycobacterium simiae TaxID=1784 RepID=UPI0021CD7722|nr:helix-turn-helix domain-containing protein [Mycobacterium simiae]
MGGQGRRGLVDPGNLALPGGRGHRLNFAERVAIMRGRDAGLSVADAATELGRDRGAKCGATRTSMAATTR